MTGQVEPVSVCAKVSVSQAFSMRLIIDAPREKRFAKKEKEFGIIDRMDVM